jgi:hypothetical protein
MQVYRCDLTRPRELQALQWVCHPGWGGGGRVREHACHALSSMFHGDLRDPLLQASAIVRDTFQW